LLKLKVVDLVIEILLQIHQVSISLSLKQEQSKWSPKESPSWLG